MSRLIVIPTQIEAAELIAFAGFRPAEQANLLELPGTDWKLMIAGIGCVPVIYNLTKHFTEFTYDLVVHAGIAGSYFLPLQPGEVVQVTRDTFADFGLDIGGSFRWIFHEGLWAPDEKPFRAGWMEVPEDVSLKLDCVTSITVNIVTASPERKLRLTEKFNPQIESMEGAAVLYVCKKEDIPVIQIRAISNYTGIRDRKSWKIEEANKALTNILTNLL